VPSPAARPTLALLHCAVVAEECYQGFVAFSLRDLQWSAVAGVFCVYIRTVVDEELGHAGLAGFRGCVEGRPVVRILRVCIRATPKDYTHRHVDWKPVA